MLEVTPTRQKFFGTVKWFDRLKGYGFILPEDGSREVFVHYSAITGEGYRNLEQGERVQYELVDAGRGPQARGVVRQGSTTIPMRPILPRVEPRFMYPRPASAD